MAMGRAGPIQSLPSPFSNAAMFDGMMYSPEVMQDDGTADFQRPCTRGQLGSAAVVSYVDLDRGMLPTSGSDSLGVSGAEGVSAEPVGKEKKKVGRPISFRGDINSKDLTEAERRRIKRRVANRESARRVRQKRQETMEEMQARMDAMQRQTAALTARLQEVEQHKAMLVAQLNSMRDKWSVAVSENLRLVDEAARSPSGNGPHETSSGRSTATEVDLVGIPSASCVPVSPPAAAQPACYWPPAPAYGAYAPVSTAAAAAGAVTSGQPDNMRIPSVTSSTQISGFRPGVSITSAVPYPKTSHGQQQQQHPQPHNMSPQPPFAASAAPMLAPATAPPAISMAPAAGSMYLQGPDAPATALCSEGMKQDVPHASLLQQHVAVAPASLKDAPSLDWEWFLHQSSLEPLLEESNALKGV